MDIELLNFNLQYSDSYNLCLIGNHDEVDHSLQNDLSQNDNEEENEDEDENDDDDEDENDDEDEDRDQDDFMVENENERTPLKYIEHENKESRYGNMFYFEILSNILLKNIFNTW